ncbi:MAG: glycosyltransferase family 2 protein [Candidatus Saganbacteria bacterium]|nr:glycosyltransferase family 2 protein [Candidatus Saganbacteria bacterium]
MDLSICIVGWNVREFLKKCLDSIYTNPPACDFEVIVTDNNSSDGSVEMVRASYPRVNLIINNNNLGFSTANNQCIKQSKGKYILLLNPDTEVLPGALDKLIAFFNGHPDAAAVAPKLLNPDLSLQRSVLSFPTLGAMIMRLIFIEQIWPGNPYSSKYLMAGFKHDMVMEIDQPMGAAIMLRKDVLDKVGLFDEESFMFFDEVDLCTRIKKAGWKIFFTPTAQIVHHGGSSIKKWGPLKLGKHWTRSRNHYFKKHFGWKTLSVLIFFDVIRAFLIFFAAVLLCYIGMNIFRYFIGFIIITPRAS